MSRPESPGPETRLSLVVRLSNPRDCEAWKRFVAEYEPFLMSLFQQHGLQHADASDAAQQVLVAVSNRVGDWQPDGRGASFRRWLATIARNAALKSLIRATRGPQTCLVETDTISESPVDDSHRTEFRRQALASSMESIREEFRPVTWRAFWATTVEGQSIESICAELRLSPGAVYMARSRIMARLREKTRDFDPDHD